MIRPWRGAATLGLIGWLAALFCATGGGAAAETVRGTVLWEGGKGTYPVAFAEISFCDTESGKDCHRAITGSTGAFFLGDVAPGTYALETALSSGFTFTSEVTVRAGRINEFTIVAPAGK